MIQVDITDNIVEVTIGTSAESSGNQRLLIQDEGTDVLNNPKILNFTGAGVTATRNGNTVDVDIPGGGGGSGTEATFAEALAGTNSSKFMSPRRVRQVAPKVFNVEGYGAVHDGVQVADGSINSSSATLTSATANFSSADVGKIIVVSGAGAAGAALKTTISAYISATQITLSNAASTTSSTAFVVYGTDDTVAIQTAINAAHSALGGTVYFPNGIYIINGALQTSISGTNPNCQIYFPSEADTALSSFTPVSLVGESSVGFASYFYGISGKGVILISTLITSSGTNPAVIGTTGASGNYLSFNYSEIHLENISVRVLTNNGGQAPYLSAINLFNSSKVSGKNVSASTETGMFTSSSASGSGTFGLAISKTNNNGPNVWQESFAQGFEYGIIPGEHTAIYNCYAVGCNHGWAFTKMNYSVSGKILAHECINQIYFASGSTFLSIDNQQGLYGFVDLVAEIEIDTFGKWWDTTTLLEDSGNIGVGRILLLGATAGVGGNLASNLTLISSIASGKGTGLDIIPVQFAGRTPSFADDTAADAAYPGGSAPNGVIYYRTGSSKLRGKQGGAWADLA